QVIADDGELYDHASPDLERIRKELHLLRLNARRKCAELSVSQSFAPFLMDRVTHFRKGRLTLLVRMEDVHRFEGIAHDRSGSGKGVYIEPRELVPLNNRIEILRSEESEEERKILTRLTSMVIEKKTAITEAENSVALVDIIYACARIMEEPGWSLPELVDSSRFYFRDLWNPLIGPGCVPIDIHCGDRFRQLVITGPNTGGKTVVLKSVSIAVFLALSGLPVPAAEGSVVGGMDFLAADIGDEQGIEQSLSTFSSHISRIVMMIERAGRDSLLLLDELGAGTDPQEGAALGVAILEKLREKRCLVLATTHHNPIKRFAVTSRGIESASMEFDPVTFSPTFNLLMGVPGKSNAILIARRLGMPDDVISAAERNLSGDNISAEQLMEEIFEKQVELERAGKESAEERRRLVMMQNDLEERIRHFAQKEDKILIEANNMAIKILEEAEETARKLLKGMEKAAESAARREFEKNREGVSSLKKNIAGREESLQKKQTDREETPEPGDTVRIAGTEARGVVESIDGEKAVVVAGVMRIDVPLESLIRVKPEKGAQKKTPSASFNIPAPSGVPSSIMVRGMTIDEAMPEVEVYLDRAFRSGHGEVVVIHGRGEGILRRAVHALCADLPYVTGYRLGNADEGGYGVTVVSFRSR
ncbi:MAG: Smr/MutS family protein, partial [Thermovirgaceae bacterium]|nr:Smr/MutS family protein [Thermovirgaceae bacterium]